MRLMVGQICREKSVCVCVCGDLHFRPVKFASTERAQAFVYNPANGRRCRYKADRLVDTSPLSGEV